LIAYTFTLIDHPPPPPLGSSDGLLTAVPWSKSKGGLDFGKVKTVFDN
jgi:hypothetical protein